MTEVDCIRFVFNYRLFAIKFCEQQTYRMTFNLYSNALYASF